MSQQDLDNTVNFKNCNAEVLFRANTTINTK